MELFAGYTSLISENFKSRAWTVFQVFLGSLFLMACSQIAIPFYPVPLTMQTLGVFLLALMQGSKKASSSTIFYLVFVSMGLPVLSGGVSQSLWITLPSAGYLMAFPIAAFVIGKLVEGREKTSNARVLIALVLGQFIIYSFGILGLMRILSFKQSVMVGLIPFLPVAGFKLLLTLSFNKLWMQFKKR